MSQIDAEMLVSLRTELQQREEQVNDLTDLLYDDKSKMSAIDWKTRAEAAEARVSKFVADELEFVQLRAKKLEDLRKSHAVEIQEWRRCRDAETAMLSKEKKAISDSYNQAREDHAKAVSLLKSRIGALEAMKLIAVALKLQKQLKESQEEVNQLERANEVTREENLREIEERTMERGKIRCHLQGIVDDTEGAELTRNFAYAGDEAGLRDMHTLLADVRQKIRGYRV